MEEYWVIMYDKYLVEKHYILFFYKTHNYNETFLHSNNNYKYSYIFSIM